MKDAAESSAGFSWFPGHMARGLREISEDLRLVDLVLVLLDARIPRSSRHEAIEAMLEKRGKSFAFVLNKSDLAEPAATRRWVRYFENQGIHTVATSAADGRGLGTITKAIDETRARAVARARLRGRIDAPVRLLIAGIPNVGKSSIINRLTTRTGSRHAPARTGKQPGVTRSRQWIALPGGLELRDSPGILFPRIATFDMFLHLAATGAIKEDNLPIEDVGNALVHLLVERGSLEVGLDKGESALHALARKRGMLLSGGQPDSERAAHYLLKVVREGRLGPMSLELPETASEGIDETPPPSERSEKLDETPPPE